MRKLFIASALVAAVAVAVPVALAATSGRANGSLDRQQAAWKSAAVSSSSRAWRTIPRLSFISTASGSHTLCTRNELSVSLSLNLRGAPVLFRVVLDGGAVLEPGPARFVPGAGSETFAATFVGHAGTFEGSDGHALEVQWRSPTGGVVTLDRAVANVLYEQGVAGPPC
jgi:hypothetical protein